MGVGSSSSSGRKRSTKVMKIDGETLKLATPITASEVLNRHPDHHLFDSQSLTNFGLRAAPLEPHHQLRPKALYCLLQLPPPPRRLHVSATDRLHCLMLSRRSISMESSAASPAQVKFRLPRAEVERLLEECTDKAEVAERIVDLYVREGFRGGGDGGGDETRKTAGASSGKAREKRVSFVQMDSSTQ